MASLSSSTYASSSQHRQWLRPPNSPCSRFVLPIPSPPTLRSCFSSSSGSRHSLFVGSHPQSSRRIRCFQDGSSDSTPPDDPPPGKLETISGALSRMQDTVRIFFAVFFWMALFFWGSAWDGRDGGKHNKGNRFKR